MRRAGGASRQMQAMQMGQTVAGAIPASVTRRLSESVAVAVSRRPGAKAWDARRRMLGRHLARVLGAQAPAPGSRAMERLVDRAIASYARYWADSLRIPGLGVEELTAEMAYDGYEHIAAGRAAGRGTILALPHLGGWEWAGAHLAAIGHPISVVVERLDPPDLFDWFTSFRTGLGMQVIAAGPSAAAECAAALRANHILCLLSDRLVADTAGVEVDFFAERTSLPAGPAVLAMRTGAVLLPVAVYFRDQAESHLGMVRPPLDTARRGAFRTDIQRVTQDLAWSFEDLIRGAPTQWHLMQPNWPSDRDPHPQGALSGS